MKYSTQPLPAQRSRSHHILSTTLNLKSLSLSSSAPLSHDRFAPDQKNSQSTLELNGVSYATNDKCIPNHPYHLPVLWSSDSKFVPSSKGQNEQSPYSKSNQVAASMLENEIHPRNHLENVISNYSLDLPDNVYKDKIQRKSAFHYMHGSYPQIAFNNEAKSFLQENVPIFHESISIAEEKFHLIQTGDKVLEGKYEGNHQKDEDLFPSDSVQDRQIKFSQDLFEEPTLTNEESNQSFKRACKSVDQQIQGSDSSNENMKISQSYTLSPPKVESDRMDFGTDNNQHGNQFMNALGDTLVHIANRQIIHPSHSHAKSIPESKTRRYPLESKMETNECELLFSPLDPINATSDVGDSNGILINASSLTENLPLNNTTNLNDGAKHHNSFQHCNDNIQKCYLTRHEWDEHFRRSDTKESNKSLQRDVQENSPKLDNVKFESVEELDENLHESGKNSVKADNKVLYIKKSQQSDEIDGCFQESLDVSSRSEICVEEAIVNSQTLGENFKESSDYFTSLEHTEESKQCSQESDVNVITFSPLTDVDNSKLVIESQVGESFQAIHSSASFSQSTNLMNSNQNNINVKENSKNNEITLHDLSDIVLSNDEPCNETNVSTDGLKRDDADMSFIKSIVLDKPNQDDVIVEGEKSLLKDTIQESFVCKKNVIEQCGSDDLIEYGTSKTHCQAKIQLELLNSLKHHLDLDKVTEASMLCPNDYMEAQQSFQGRISASKTVPETELKNNPSSSFQIGSNVMSNTEHWNINCETNILAFSPLRVEDACMKTDQFISTVKEPPIQGQSDSKNINVSFKEFKRSTNSDILLDSREEITDKYNLTKPYNSNINEVDQSDSDIDGTNSCNISKCTIQTPIIPFENNEPSFELNSSKTRITQKSSDHHGGKEYKKEAFVQNKSTEGLDPFNNNYMDEVSQQSKSLVANDLQVEQSMKDCISHTCATDHDIINEQVVPDNSSLYYEYQVDDNEPSLHDVTQKEKPKSQSIKVFTWTPLFASNSDSVPQSQSDGLYVSGQITALPSLAMSSSMKRSIRVGLSKRQKVKHLHRHK